MKAVLFILVVFLGSQAVLAQQFEYLYPQGRSTGFCFGTNSWFCIEQLKDQADEDCLSQADLQCRIRSGRLDRFSLYSTSYCNPSNVPPQDQAWVSCTSSCTVRCEFP